MKPILSIVLALLSSTAALPNVSPRASASNGKGPHNVNCKAGKTYDLNFSLGVSVPTIANPDDLLRPTIKHGGYRFALPRAALSGLLVSFLGNFDTNQTTTSQITTVSNSTSIEGGVSFTNASASANQTTIVALTFSSGNASS